MTDRLITTVQWLLSAVIVLGMLRLADEFAAKRENIPGMIVDVRCEPPAKWGVVELETAEGRVSCPTIDHVCSVVKIGDPVQVWFWRGASGVWYGVDFGRDIGRETK